jgi:starch phosphorylase
MANLCIVSSHAVNGVAAIHTNLLKTSLFKDFDKYFTNKIRNKTNGVTPRRWIHCSNPNLSALWAKSLGSYSWLTDLDSLKILLPQIEDHDFREEFHQIKQQNKQRLADWVQKECGVQISTEAMFDVQVKRIHEYKRQHLFALYMIYRYIWIKEMAPEGRSKIIKRVFMVGGKAAPGYIAAKKIIKLITSIGDVVNRDPDIGDLMKVVFLPNYNVSNAQIIIPGTDLSEQISTAGTEASGTSNMKFVMNGAVIIGTLDGANVEIAEEVGLDNIIIFGAKVDEVERIRNKRELAGSRLRKCFDCIRNGTIGNPRELGSIVDGLENNDFYIVKHDFYLYLDAQEKADKLFSHKEKWLRMTMSGALKMGKFSSDRTIDEYAEDIWSLEKVKVLAPSSCAIGRVRSLPNLVPADVKLDNRRKSLRQREATLIFAIPKEVLEKSLIDLGEGEDVEE